MGDVLIGRARRLAIERVLTVLRSQTFRDQVATEAAFFGIANQPAPLERHIFATDPDPREIEDVERNTGVSVYVWPETPRQVVSRKSGGAQRFAADTQFQIAVVTIFKTRPQVPPTRAGVQLGADELMRLRMEAYNSAVIETLTTYAANNDQIHEMLLESDDTTPVYGEERMLYGVATATFTARQECTIGNRLRLPT